MIDPNGFKISNPMAAPEILFNVVIKKKLIIIKLEYINVTK